MLLAVVFPLIFTNATVTNIAVQTVIFVAVASAWNIFSGYSGYLSLGHAIFFGTGAYAVGIAARDWRTERLRRCSRCCRWPGCSRPCWRFRSA